LVWQIYIISDKVLF